MSHKPTPRRYIVMFTGGVIFGPVWFFLSRLFTQALPGDAAERLMLSHDQLFDRFALVVAVVALGICYFYLRFVLTVLRRIDRVYHDRLPFFLRWPNPRKYVMSFSIILAGFGTGETVTTIVTGLPGIGAGFGGIGMAAGMLLAARSCAGSEGDEAFSTN